MAATTCVGRGRELAELSSRCAATATRGADIVAVVGASGIGKSTVLRRLISQREAARWARATPWESGLPGGVLSQLLQEKVPAEPVAAAEQFVDRITGLQPALVVVDDAEHADELSLHALVSAVRHHRRLPLLVVVSTTSPQVIADAVSEEIRLEGLEPPAVAEIAASRGLVLHPAMSEILTRHTGGNPRAVVALLDELPIDVWSRPGVRLPAPSHVVADVADRLKRCGSAGRALVEALAILDDHESLGAAAALSGLEDPLTAIDEAADAGLLAPSPGFSPRLRDSLTRAAVIDLMGAHAAGEAHRRAARMGADPVRRLHHLIAATATPDPGLAEDAERLAHERASQGAWAEAARLLREASRLSSDPALHDERLTRSVDALIAAGDCLGAAALVPTIESLHETPLRDAVLAYLAILRGRAAEAEVRLRRAWDIADAGRDPETAAMIAQRRVLHSLVRCRTEELVHWADRALALAGGCSPAGIEAAAIRGLGLAAAGKVHEAAVAYDTLASRISHGAQAQRIGMGRGWFQLSQDDIDGARSSLEAAVAMAALGGSTRITLWALGWLARVQFVTGEWDRALDSVERGRALAGSSGIVLATPLLAWTAAQVHALRGDWKKAAADVLAADAVTGDYEMMRIPPLLARAHVAEAKAYYAAVRRTLEPLTRLSADTTVEPGLWPWADVLATALVVDGQLDSAEALLRRHEHCARGHRSATARVLAARGRLLGARADLPAARRAFQEALALLEGLPLRYDLARVYFGYGLTLRRAGKRGEADAAISTARDLYLSLGAHTYVQRCERELRAGGVHQLRRPRAPVTLTSQEEAVTALVAQGLSNREVAAELYVSPKTVQYHLTRIYPKLGVRSRAELAALRR
ncbi:MAG: LuxR C-terminal-related transcriptional regulator [Mycobacterium sp.]|uniref:LuxR C-terminal-related transcriptional regulator n=1 Tax=Mycobacterium sp. TaxID=1785 RepID=UPI00261315B0|nr:LuxR family transcriptional regulator [Mycobacterium sp.]MDI3313799.1 LuxR C-terminal-related transcriptional regulator [Mycobacterium sp.]